MRGRIRKVFLLLSFALAFVYPVAAETLEQRLARQTDFIPRGAPLDQLIEVGRRFRIPLGVEWLEDEEEGAPAPAPLSFRGGSVGQLIESIVRRSPGHQLSFGRRVVHVYSVHAYSHPFNFLNLRLGRVGSLTKQFTAMAVMVLQERGKLKVSDPVCNFIPECPRAWAGVTIHHLLTHTSGIPDLVTFPDFQQTMALPSPVDKTVERFKTKPPEFEPGAKFKYSNSGYVLLGYIIETTHPSRPLPPDTPQRPPLNIYS